MEGLSNFGLVTYKSFRANLCEILSNFVASRGFNSGKPNTDLVQVYVFLFFSSRRRHTRLQGDWSSDVCSSDLRTGPARARRRPRRRRHRADHRGGALQPDRHGADVAAQAGRRRGQRHGGGGRRRSEERRVGEEGRSRWAPYHLKKKKKRRCTRE